MWVYLNDQLVTQEHAMVSVFDRGFLYGDGVFETFRVYNKHPLFLNRHVARLHQSCQAIQLPLPNPEPCWSSLLQNLLEQNHLDNTLIRLTISRGLGEVGPDPSGCHKPTVVLFPRPLPRLTPTQSQQGVSISIVSVRRHSPTSLPPHMKSLNYLNTILAKQEVLHAQTFDGVLLNIEGYVAEGTTSNIFFAKDHALYTPSLACGILPGITREVILGLAEQEGIPIEQGVYRPDELIQADECFLTNTGFGVLPVCNIGGHYFQSGNAGSLTRTVQERYEQHIKGDATSLARSRGTVPPPC